MCDYDSTFKCFCHSNKEAGFDTDNAYGSFCQIIELNTLNFRVKLII